MEENKNMADDLADGAKTAAQDAKTLAKAGANLAAGNIAGAVKEVAKNPEVILHVIEAVFLAVIAMGVALLLLICCVLGVVNNLASCFTQLFSGEEGTWSIEANYEEYETKLEKIYKKAYKRCRKQAERHYNIISEAVHNAWESLDVDGADEVDLTFRHTYSGMFGDDVGDSSDDDQIAINQNIMRMLEMYDLWNASMADEESTDHDESYYTNIEEDENWDEYDADSLTEDYEETKNTPTLKGLRKLIKENKDLLFKTQTADISALSPDAFSFSGTVAINDTNNYITTATDNGIETEYEGESEKSVQKYELEVMTFIQYTGEQEFKDQVFQMSPEDYQNAMGMAEALSIVVGYGGFGSMDNPEIQAILAELRSQGISEDRIAVVEAALKGVGMFQYSQPLRSLAGTGPDNFTVGQYLDCSSFVRWSYWSAGFDSDCSTTADYASSSYFHRVDRSEKQPGDVFWHQNARGVRHVVIYGGNIGGQDLYIECTSPGSVMTYGDCYYGNISSYQYCYRYNAFD